MYKVDFFEIDIIVLNTLFFFVGLFAISFKDIISAFQSGKGITRTETLMSNGYRNGSLTFTITGKLPSDKTGDTFSSPTK